MLYSFCDLQAQMQLRRLDGFYNNGGVKMYDINNSGQSVNPKRIYSFATNTYAEVDSGVLSLAGINESGDLIGYMPIVIDGQTLPQPAYKKNGVWQVLDLFPNQTSQSGPVVGKISPNLEYLTGTYSIAPNWSTQRAFLYNVATNSTEIIATPLNENNGGNCVTDLGLIGGWYQPSGSSVNSVPATLGAGSVINPINADQPFNYHDNTINAINNSNVMVGSKNISAFIFDSNTNSISTFPPPSNYRISTFTDISDTGIAVGYYLNIFTADGNIADAIVYNPALSSQPVLLRDILVAHGIDIPFYNDRMGIATAISPDGKYISGYANDTDGSSGWVVYLEDLLLTTCFMSHPSDIYVTAENFSGIVNYTMPTVTCNFHPNATLILASGYASGAVFPDGITTVTHNLVDTDGAILDSCTFKVTVSCYPAAVQEVTPITSVSVENHGGHTSSADSTLGYEDFTTQFYGFNLFVDYPGQDSLIITLNGNTGGNYTDYFTVFVDWNKDGIFNNTEERNDIGQITNSTGTDAVSTTGTISIPFTDITDPNYPNPNTYSKIRIIKNRDAFTLDACSVSSGIGQIEDYHIYFGTLLLSNTAFVEASTIQYAPNPVTDVLKVTSQNNINNIQVFNLVGQIVLEIKLNSKTGALDFSGLPKGTYLVKTIFEQSTKTVKVIKK